MKIAILADSLDIQYAGIKRFTKNLIENLSHQDKDNEYFIIRPSNKNEFKNVRSLQVEISKFPFSHRLRQFGAIPRLLKRLNIDVVIEPAHFGPYNLPKSIKRITVIHDLSPILFKQFHSRASYLAHKYILPFSLKKADKIIAVSENTKRDLQKLFIVPEHKIAVVPNFLSESKGATVQLLPSIKRKYFLVVGTVEPRKNHLQTIEAFINFKSQSKSQTQLIIIGKDGWKNKAFKTKMANNPFKEDIIWLQDVTDSKLSYFYQNASCLIFNTYYEGFGYPILEAMQFSCPVIAANNSSIPEVLGNGGWLFDSQEELTNHMLKLDKTENVKLLKKMARQRFITFSEKPISKLWMEVLNELKI